MPIDPSPDVQAALQLFRRGRFTETVSLLQHSPRAQSPRKYEPHASVLLADALQRTGSNDAAEQLARSTLTRLGDKEGNATARLHLVLGNVVRERGNLPAAIRHFQIAATHATNDLECSCWAHLRLLTTVAEFSGIQAASARIDAVKRVLTRHGDARPFAALHLWHVEIDTMRGALESAWHHLSIANSLLAKVDDAWLSGYLAVNSSVLHYYSADVHEARRWADRAIAKAQESGHQTTRRAAYANLGYYEFASGNLATAEEYFQIALRCCERGSANEIAILDNIAEVKLELADFDGCRLILSQLDSLEAQHHDEKKRQYKAWALQTRIKLHLREGKNIEATNLSRQAQKALAELPHFRLGTESRLLAAETLLNTDPSAAADVLAPIFLEGTQLAPDLFAELERVTGKALGAFGFSRLARLHIDRAASVFGTIGHSLGRERALRELLPSSESAASASDAELFLDRFRALLDTRDRAELFGHEAIAVLNELGCAKGAELSIVSGASAEADSINGSDGYSPVQNRICISLGARSQKPFILSFVPLDDAKSKLVSLAFKRVIDQLLASAPNGSEIIGQDVVWTCDDNSANDQGVVFASEAMLSVLRTVKQIASTDLSVLVTGETGTGKEIIARTIHEHSRRAFMPFIAVNCAAIPKDLIESQLFGHRKGAFSGALENYQGIVRAANGGTLFLDEIGEIPNEMQAKLLRFLEMSEVHPVGEPHPVKVNVRLLFATNGDLEEAVSQNRFRRDLFYRLNVIPIKLPALRDRREEVPILANVFAQRFAKELSKQPLSFSTEAMEHLIFYAWPGNIRELSNEVRRLSAVLDSGAQVKPHHLAAQLITRPQVGDTSIRMPQLSVRIDQSIGNATAILESEMIKHALRRTNGCVGAAAKALGISRKGLYLKRSRLGLTAYHNQS